MRFRDKSLIQKVSLVFSFLLFTLFVGFFLFIFPFTIDKTLFTKPVEKNKIKMGSENIRKENLKRKIFLVDKENRPTIQMEAKNSLALLTAQAKGKFAYEELLNDLSCFFHEKIDSENNLQRIRHFTTEEAYFDLDAKTLFSQEGKLDIFTFPGQEMLESFPPHDSSFIGLAQDVTVQFHKKYPDICAKSLHALVDNPLDTKKPKEDSEP